MNPRFIPSIDFAAASAAADLYALMEAAGVHFRGRRAACLLHGGSNPTALAISDDGTRWKCFNCGLGGDAIDWIVATERLTKIEAAARLLGVDPPRDPRPPAIVITPCPTPNLPAEPKRRPWHDPAWQGAVETIVVEAEASLWSSSGRGALDWLRDRGLIDSTIRRFRLGWLPDGRRSKPLDALAAHDGNPRPIRASRGVTIPWVAPDATYATSAALNGPRWVGCNVRQLTEDFSAPPPPEPKYKAVAGSERGHAYPFTHAAPGVPALICEGEFDALIAWQEVGWIVNVLTVGGASQAPAPDAKALLSTCPVLALLFDHDPNMAGDRAAWKFAAAVPTRSCRLWLPGANDLNAFYREGGNVVAWLKTEFERLDWRWAAAPRLEER